MPNGVMNWWIKNDRTGRILNQDGSTRAEALRIAETEALETGDTFSVSPSDMTEFETAPFYIAVYDRQITSPAKRLGDDLDVAEYVDRLIETLFQENKMDSQERDRCYDILHSLHGSAYAGGWLERTWFDHNLNSFKQTSDKQYTVVAFTRHEITVYGETSWEVIERAKDKLCESVDVTATRENTVFMVARNT